MLTNLDLTEKVYDHKVKKQISATRLPKFVFKSLICCAIPCMRILQNHEFEFDLYRLGVTPVIALNFLAK